MPEGFDSNGASEGHAPAFREVHRTPGWVRGLSAGVLALIGGLVVLVALFAPRPVGVAPALIVGVSAGLGAAGAGVALFGRQRVEVTASHVVLTFTPFWRRRLPLEAVEVAAEDELKGLEYGGFGVRLLGRGRTAVAANPGPMLGLEDRSRPRRYLVRTDRPKELRDAIAAAHRRP